MNILGLNVAAWLTCFAGICVSSGPLGEARASTVFQLAGSGALLRLCRNSPSSVRLKGLRRGHGATSWWSVLPGGVRPTIKALGPPETLSLIK